MTGWPTGRPLMANTRRTAFSFKPSAARPYTVSVGRPTTSPAANSRTARLESAEMRAAVTAKASACAGRVPRPQMVDHPADVTHAGAAELSLAVRADHLGLEHIDVLRQVRLEGMT